MSATEDDDEPVAKPVACETVADRVQKPIDFDALKALTDAMRPQPVPARIWVRSMRDKARY